MNSDIVKPEKFGHLHLVDHFIVPLIIKTKGFVRIFTYCPNFNYISNEGSYLYNEN